MVHRVQLIIIGILLNLLAVGELPASVLSATYLHSIGETGTALELAQPQRIRYDQHHEEYYIADTGHNRILILDQRGFYTFEFGNNELMQAPYDVAVDSQGYIYVLCNPVSGNSVQVFDYNGDYLHPFNFQGGPQSSSLVMNSLVIDPQDQLYFADAAGKRVLIYHASGEFISAFPIFSDLSEQDSSEQELGSIYWKNNQIYIPAPLSGVVFCFNQDGSLVKTVGHPGGGYGELSYPVSVALDEQGNVLVLDKHRHTIISYDNLGNVNGEFGGLGINPGWFYYPVYLFVDQHNQAWVAQGLNNLIQVLQLPLPEVPAAVGKTN